MIQSGPDPASAKATLLQTPPRRQSDAETATASPARAACGQNHRAEIENET
jgi:hypothetical protein